MKILVLLVSQVAALSSPLWWFAVRTRYASEGRWELIALVAAVAYVAVRFRKIGPTVSASLALPSFLTVACALTSYCLPPLFVMWFAWVAIAASISSLMLGRRMDLHLLALLTLSLPVIPLFQYHLSFPLRVLVADASAFLLASSGLAVVREGACLAFGEQLIWVDAPCSGLRMMWSGLFLTVCLAAMNGHGFAKTARMLGIALAIVVLGNVLRTTSLFYVEAELILAPAWILSAAGISIYCVMVGLLLFLLRPKKGQPCLVLGVS